MGAVYGWTLLGCLSLTAASLVGYLSRLRRKRHRDQQDPTRREDGSDW